MLSSSSDSDKGRGFSAAVLIREGRAVPLQIVNELLAEARRRGFRLEVTLFSNGEPQDAVASLLPLITSNHSVTLILNSKKISESTPRDLLDNSFDKIYIEKDFAKELNLKLEGLGEKAEEFSSEVRDPND